MFKWVGRKQREEEWMAQPRRLPAFIKERPDGGGDRWFVTQEFINKEDQNKRVYIAAWQPDPKVERWEILKVTCDLTKEDGCFSRPEDFAYDPMGVIEALRTHERWIKNSERHIPHPDHHATYRAFANKHGIHFDDDGNVIRVAKEAPLAKDVFMNRDSLDKLFAKAAAATAPLDTWQGVYEAIVDKSSPDWTVTEEAFGPDAPREGATRVVPAPVPYDSDPWQPPAAPPKMVTITITLLPGQQMIVAKTASVPDGDAKPPAEKGQLQPILIKGLLPEKLADDKPFAGWTPLHKLAVTRPVRVGDLVQDKAYAEYGYTMGQMLKRLGALPAQLTAPGGRYGKEDLIENISQYSPDLPYNGDKARLAQHAADACLLVGLLRAGAALYQEQFGPGKTFTAEGLQLVSTVGNACVNLAVKKLGIPFAEAEKIKDVISKGADPFGPELPLEKIFAQNPPPAYEPAREMPYRRRSRPEPPPPPPRAYYGRW